MELLSPKLIYEYFINGSFKAKSFYCDKPETIKIAKSKHFQQNVIFP